MWVFCRVLMVESGKGTGKGNSEGVRGSDIFMNTIAIENASEGVLFWCEARRSKGSLLLCVSVV